MPVGLSKKGFEHVQFKALIQPLRTDRGSKIMHFKINLRFDATL